MALQASISLIYGVIENSWIVAAFLLKYVAGVQLIYAAKSDGKPLDNFQDVVSDYSRETITGILLLGTFSYILNINISAAPQLLSYSIALIYIGYLFWDF